MPLSRRQKWMTGPCVGVALVALVGAVWATRTHELLKSATRITEGSFTSYAWESPVKVVLFQTPTENQAQPFVERDLGTGVQTLGTFGHAVVNISGWRASPDGLRLLSAGTDSPFYVVGLREVERYQRAFGEYTYGEAGSPANAAAWLPDSRRWLAWAPVRTKESLRLYSVDAPRDASVNIPAPKAMTMLLGVTPDHLIVQADAPPPPATADKVTIATFGVYPNRAAVRSIPITLPVTAQIKELEMAPKGDRLAWTLVDSRRSPLITMLVRTIPSLASRFPATAGTSVWVSRLDGTEMHEIGFEQTVVTGKTTRVPFDVRWNPDGKQLSFRLHDALYSVPAP